MSPNPALSRNLQNSICHGWKHNAHVITKSKLDSGKKSTSLSFIQHRKWLVPSSKHIQSQQINVEAMFYPRSHDSDVIHLLMNCSMTTRSLNTSGLHLEKKNFTKQNFDLTQFSFLSGKYCWKICLSQMTDRWWHKTLIASYCFAFRINTV